MLLPTLLRVLQIRTVPSLDAPELAPFRSLRKPDAPAHLGRFIAEGPNVVTRLLASPLAVESLLATEAWLAHFRPALERRSENITVHVAAEAALRELVGFHLSNGVLAAGLIPPNPTLEQLLSGRTRTAPESPGSGWWLALDGITSSENVGTIIRSSVAFGAHGVLCGETGSSPWLRRAVRVAMGATFHIPVRESTSLAEDLQQLAVRGVRIASLEADRGTPLDAIDLRLPTCFVVGSEGAGARPEIHAACTEHVTVPMPGGFDSLNVAAAAAVAANERLRQRRAAPQVGRSRDSAAT